MSDETESDFAEAWRPDPGDTITGTMIGVEVIDPNKQGPYPCLTLRTSSGEVKAVHAFHQVLRNGIARRRPKVGDELTITYRGKKEGGAYGGYHDYHVVGGQQAEMNWDSWLPEDERQHAVPTQGSASAFGDAASSGRATAEPPIAPAPVPAADEWAPLPKPPSAQEKAEQFGSAPPF